MRYDAPLGAALLGAALLGGTAAAQTPTSQPAPPAASAPSPPAPPTAEGTRYALLVVGVYRPLDLEGRTVVEPREVYLQSVGPPEGPLDDLIGRTLSVTRQVPVPAAVPMPDPEAPADPPDAGLGFDDSADPDEDTGPTPLAVPRVPTPVGRVEVTAIRGEVVVARVVEDGVGPLAEPAPGGALEAAAPPSRLDVPAVMAGDLVAYVEPAPPPPKPPPLSAEEKARLDAEQRRLEADDARRKARPKPYERPVMRWKL